MKNEDVSRIEISDLTSLWDAIKEAKSFFEGIYPFWRGHANFVWPLQAEVFRTRVNGKRHDEVSLIRYFMAHAEARHRQCPTTGDYLGWLMLARHHGLPTRLLDWSWSPMVALYFAVQEDENGPNADGCIWALEPGRMNLQMMGERRFLAPDEAPVLELADIAFEFKKDRRDANTLARARKAFAIGGREIDLRVLVQQGAFTIHADDTDLTDLDYVYPNDRPDRPPWRRAFRVPTVSKLSLLEALRAVGIHRSALFPDLSALAEDIKSRPMLS